MCIANHGISSMLLKVGAKRRRTKEQIEDDRLAEAQRLQAVEEHIAENKALRDKLEAKQAELEMASGA